MEQTRLSIAMTDETVASARYLNINEIFGPTVQGEGPHTGRLVGFLRLAGCNLACSWCDTPYSWDWERYSKSDESHRLMLSDVAEEVDKQVIDRLIITGGEPMLQQRALVALKSLMPLIAFEIETNGTIGPTLEMVEATNLFTVSPKLSHSGDEFKSRIKEKAIEAFTQLSWDGKAVFKFVAREVDDLDEVQQMIRQFKIPREAVWIMPEGANAADHTLTLRRLADYVIDRGWNLSTRLHVLVWGQSRGH